jgi:anti-sigma regulatory factor (Ser/Thr protein kinase)
MSAVPDIRLVLPNRPENVALVRQALGALAASVGMQESLLADMKTAVSEACNNVVLHAYDDGVGPLEVHVRPDTHEVEVVVRDHGTGIQPREPEPEAAMQGVGLSLIQALTEKVEVVGGAEQGTEVRMSFRSDPALDVNGDRPAQTDMPEPPPGDTVVSASARLAGPVLASVIAVLAARAGFSVERLSEAQIVTDAIAAHAAVAFPGPQVNAAIDTAERRLELRVGPLVVGGADRLVASSAVGGLAPVLERLTDEMAIERRDGGEDLRLAIVDRR